MTRTIPILGVIPTQVGIFLVYFGFEIPVYAAVRRIGMTIRGVGFGAHIPVRGPAGLHVA